MGDPNKIDNIEPFPINPRLPVISDPSSEADLQNGTRVRLKHSLTPLKGMSVDYWHAGEQPSANWKKTGLTKQINHAKRADQFGLLLLASALCILFFVGATLYLNSKQYLFSSSKLDEKNTAVVDFYQGNHAFSKKVAEEKAAKLGHSVNGISQINDDLEIPLNEQMQSMEEKLKQMRSVKEADESPPPSPDTGRKVGLNPLKPIKDSNFQSPLEFNSALPKNLQKTP